MQLIDSHSHLNMLDLSADNNNLQAVFDRAQLNSVTHMLCVGVDLEHHQQIIHIAEKFENVDASVGLHPNEIVEHEPTIAELIKLGSHSKIAAIGETGLDYYRNQGDDMRWQQDRFRNHIRAAIELNKAIIVHSRFAPDDTINILKEEKANQVGAVMHCFTESWEMAKAALDLGFYISFSGIITFKNAESLREVVKKVPLESMLIETDCPYLAPDPYRGKQNEPAFVKYTAEKIAEIKNVDLKTVAEHTSKNYFKLFYKKHS